MGLAGAIHQSWPPFVLVSGLLLVGLAANADGAFARAGAALEQLPGPPVALLAACMALVAVVTAILNLDTAVVFLTPVLVHAARRRGTPVEPFLFSAVFMANASSLYLPGSNLTNLLVLAREPVSGGTFGAQMLAPALAATLATALLLVVGFRRSLRGGESRDGERQVLRGPIGLLGAAAAAVLTVSLHNPALPVLGVGIVAIAAQAALGRLRFAQAVEAVGPFALGALFALSVALGVLARNWDGPASLLAGTGRAGTAAVGALAAVLVNNLPAAVLLSARSVAHPRALLIGLNLGPNLAVSGSLSAYLWFRAARQLELRPSPRTFTLRGIVLAPVAMACALAAAAAFTSVQ